MKSFINYIKNIFKLRKILCLNMSNSMSPSIYFIKENIKRSLIKVDNYSYIEILEILERLEEDSYLEKVGFRFKVKSKYLGDIKIDGEKFEEWEMYGSEEDEIILNRILIEKAELLRKEDKKKLNKLIKKIIDETF